MSYIKVCTHAQEHAGRNNDIYEKMVHWVGIIVPCPDIVGTRHLEGWDTASRLG